MHSHPEFAQPSITRYYLPTQREMDKHANGIDISPACRRVLTDEYCYVKCKVGYD